MALMSCCHKSEFQKCQRPVIDFDIGNVVMEFLTVLSAGLLARLWDVSEVIFSLSFLGTFIGRKCTSQSDSPIISSFTIKSDAVKGFLTRTKLDLAEAKRKGRQY